MKTLILMRHAKSSWSTPLTDVERPLNSRGAEAAAKLGDWLRSKNLHPDEILCSYAVRTMETTERLALGRNYTPVRQLYLASSGRLYEHLTRAMGKTVLLVAHNPGIGDFAHDLTRAPAAHPRFADYPTGATSVFTFDINSWSDLKLRSGTLTRFVIPREL
ncbi:MAG: histidine phosphatase family protein [Pseudomonadota bacterium]